MAMTHTRQPRMGPLCPVCRDPLWNHVAFPSGKVTRVRNGSSAQTCFSVGGGRNAPPL